MVSEYFEIHVKYNLIIYDILNKIYIFFLKNSLWNLWKIISCGAIHHTNDPEARSC